ncbi:hypothetical protein TNIN_84141 [Trichonephila inaurata madagascariensis]|uniref:Uncharacterized protein n=1 Tax=Trichonephila inaurata madagascariensis TaxID=2747483 RepID=A0A8X7BR46_9ARAC|nr:hypothetical protein TNIN_84141 [Trichonephila inaurata madagascariensis]
MLMDDSRPASVLSGPGTILRPISVEYVDRLLAFFTATWIEFPFPRHCLGITSSYHVLNHKPGSFHTYSLTKSPKRGKQSSAMSTTHPWGIAFILSRLSSAKVCGINALSNNKSIVIWLTTDKSNANLAVIRNYPNPLFHLSCGRLGGKG